MKNNHEKSETDLAIEVAGLNTTDAIKYVSKLTTIAEHHARHEAKRSDVA